MIRMMQIALVASLLSPSTNRPLRPDYVSSKAYQTPWSLETAFVTALREAHRGGTLIYRGKCVNETQISDIYWLNQAVATGTLNQVLTAITKKYPNIKWIDFGENEIRIVDSSAGTDVLNVRVKEFQLREVENADLAVTSIWHIPEVSAFANANHITFVLNASGLISPEGTYSRISLNLHNVTVAEIMDNISQRYQRTRDPEFRSVWSFHECDNQRAKVVELKVI